MRLHSLRFRLLHGWRKGAISLKAVSFALIGVVNTFVDYSVFFLARAVLCAVAVRRCRCSPRFPVRAVVPVPTTVSLIAANMTSWAVAVTGSYILNSSITFAAESGRKLRWRSYAVLLASGIVGWLANTATLVFAAQVLLLPIWLAKAVAILASFVVNFSLSHFVVFRVRHRPAIDVCEDA